MALAAKLQLRQSQSLVMTPQLMQSIRLLQLTHFELDRFVDEEIERNPLLERVDTSDDGTIEPQAEAHETAAENPDWFSDDNSGLDARMIAGEFDASLENIYPDEPGTTQVIGPDLTSQWKSAAGTGSQSVAGDGFDLEDFAVAARTLRDHTGEQISF